MVVEKNTVMIVDFTDIIFNKSVSCLSAVCLEVCGSLKTPIDRSRKKIQKVAKCIVEWWEWMIMEKKINLLHHFGIIWGNEDITWVFSRA